MSGKYSQLETYLRKRKDYDVGIVLTLDEIESIIGSRLPASAYRYPAWWANQTDPSGRPQVRAWKKTPGSR